MITLLTAIYPEAELLIEQFQLKKDNSFTQFQLFTGETIQLLLTGTNPLSAAIAFTHLLSKQTISCNDLFINIGLCGCNNHNYPLGSIFLCREIIDHTTNRHYYPDLLYIHPFLEATVITSFAPCSITGMKTKAEPTLLLYDMEAAGLYQAGITFLKQHQMIFLKISSDYLDPDTVTKKEILSLMKNAYPSLHCFLDHLSKRALLNDGKLTYQEEALLFSMAQALSFSATMTRQLKQLFFYGKTRHLPVFQIYSDYLSALLTDKKTQIQKKEGKQHLEQLKQCLTTHVSSYLC